MSPIQGNGISIGFQVLTYLIYYVKLLFGPARLFARRESAKLILVRTKALIFQGGEKKKETPKHLVNLTAEHLKVDHIYIVSISVWGSTE